MTKTPGLLIAVEGTDGSGLTTQSHLLVNKLLSINLKSVYTKEPTEGPIGQTIRKMLSLKHENHDMMALLFAADRVWHYREDPSLPGKGIRGAIELGYIVVTDRYKYSSLAYQGSYVDIEWVDNINKCVPEADILIYIDTPPEISIRRISARNRKELYENINKLIKIKNTFEKVLKMAKERGVLTLRIRTVENNRELSIEDISIKIYNKIVNNINILLKSPSRLSLQSSHNHCL